MEQKDNNDDLLFHQRGEHVYAQMMMEPNQRWSVDQAEQTFHALLKNGK